MQQMRGVSWASSIRLGNLPLVAIATGPDLEQGEMRGHATAFTAIGDVATGVVAMGGLARDGLAIGGLAVGLISLGGLSIGALALGGLAVGRLALGGAAIGGVAIGGVAIGAWRSGPGDRLLRRGRRGLWCAPVRATRADPSHAGVARPFDSLDSLPALK